MSELDLNAIRAQEKPLLRVPTSVKMLRETLCLAQHAMHQCDNGRDANIRQSDFDRISDLIRQCDEHRPLGVDGKHGDLHTDTCGCEGA